MSDYPEHEKLAAVAEDSQVIGQFLEGMQAKGVYLCAMADDGSEWGPTGYSIEETLAHYYGIDLTRVEAEKRDMLAKMRAMNERDLS